MKYKLNEDKVLYTELENEGVLFNVETNEYFNVNESFSDVISCIEKQKSISEIEQFFLNKYEITKEQTTEAINEVITYLKDKNYLVSVS